jgi:RNA polymerase sigma factor for flagellar operon FliA
MKRIKSENGAHVTNVNQRDDIVMRQLAQVHYIASHNRKRLPPHIEIGDLVNSGVLGLLEAYKNFDSSKNAQFGTFAKFRIRGAILDNLREADWGPRSLRRKAREIGKATAHLEAKLLRRPSVDEIAEEMHMEIDLLHRLQAKIDGLLLSGQSGPISNDDADSADLIESAPDLNNPNAFDLCLRTEINTHLKTAILGLTKREQAILFLLYHEECTLQEISRVIGVVPSRVSQIRVAALPKLRAALATLLRRGERPHVKAAA